MRTVQIQADEQFIDLSFPRAGLDLSGPFSTQSARPTPSGDYAATTRIGLNVRAYEPLTLRERGGVRSGLVRYIPAPVVAGWMIQELAVITTEQPQLPVPGAPVLDP